MFHLRFCVINHFIIPENTFKYTTSIEPPARHDVNIFTNRTFFMHQFIHHVMANICERETHIYSSKSLPMPFSTRNIHYHTSK